MPFSKQTPLVAARGRSEHDFAQSRTDWEAAVFDNASHFVVTELAFGRRPMRTEFTVFPWAVRHAAARADRVCLYAVAASGRSVHLDRERWGEWERRWREGS